MGGEVGRGRGGGKGEGEVGRRMGRWVGGRGGGKGVSVKFVRALFPVHQLSWVVQNTINLNPRLV